METLDARLRERFDQVAGKLLSRVECYGSERNSNQHELNGTAPFKELLGTQRREIPCHFIRIQEGPDGTAISDQDSTLTWYDARENDPFRTEYRLYYTSAVTVMDDAVPGDFCWLLLQVDGHFTMVVANADSESANTLDRLLGTNLRQRSAGIDKSNRTLIRAVPSETIDDLQDIDADLLAILGIHVHIDEGLLEKTIARFGGRYPLPRVRDFASFARTCCTLEIPADGDPDAAIDMWMSTTTAAFYAYERHVLQPVLDAELGGQDHIDVDKFFELANRFKNSRSSRVGLTFENHLQEVFDQCGVMWHHPTRALSDRSKPDFVFPGLEEFESSSFPNDLCTVAEAKTTAKERWAQVAARGLSLEQHFFLTMDRALSYDQLSAMEVNRIVPVLPEAAQGSYPPTLREGMMAMREFVTYVRAKQSRAVDGGLLVLS